MKKKLLTLLLILAMFIPTIVFAKAPAKVYVFYGNGCPHCTDLHNTLDKLAKDTKYKNKFEVEYIEVWYDAENRELEKLVAAHFEDAAGGVPYYVIGEKTFIGFANPNATTEEGKKAFNDSYDEIKKAIDKEYKEQKDIVGKIISGDIKVSTTTTKSVPVTVDANKYENLEAQASNSFIQNNKTLLIVVFSILIIGLFIVMFRWVAKD